MNELQIKGEWKQVKGKLKQKYGDIVEDDALFGEGKLDQLIGKIEAVTGKSKDKVTREINELF